MMAIALRFLSTAARYLLESWYIDVNETRCRTNTGDVQIENLYKENGMSVGNGMQEKHKTDITKFCIKCGAALSSDEIALHKKLYNRAAESFMCIRCSSAYLEVTQEMLTAKIEEFKKMGCTLFD